MKLELWKLLTDRSFVALDDAIHGMQALLSLARDTDESGWLNQSLIGESCNPSPDSPQPLRLGGYARDPITETDILGRIRRGVIRAVTDREFHDALEDGIFTVLRNSARLPAPAPVTSASLDRFNALHGYRLPKSLNRHHPARTLCFPEIRISGKSVVAGCAVTTAAEFRSGKKGHACAWWACSQLTDCPNPLWNPHLEPFAHFLDRAVIHFTSLTPRPR